MTTFVVYFLIVAAVLYFISQRGKPSSQAGGVPEQSKGKGLRLKRDPREIWKQVYETASIDEARQIQARLQEQGLECILYEQGKKDIHGNLLKGVGVAVPNTSTSQAQASIARMPV